MQYRIGGLVLLANLALLPAATAASPPLPVLYRMFFHQVAALDQAAKDLDGAGKSCGNELRRELQKALQFSNAGASLLQRNATSCISALEREDVKARTVVAQGKAAEKAGVAGASAAAIAQLRQLERERTDISVGCIESLKTAVSAPVRIPDEGERSSGMKLNMVPG